MFHLDETTPENFLIAASSLWLSILVLGIAWFLIWKWSQMAEADKKRLKKKQEAEQQEMVWRSKQAFLKLDSQVKFKDSQSKKVAHDRWAADDTSIDIRPN